MGTWCMRILIEPECSQSLPFYGVRNIDTGFYLGDAEELRDAIGLVQTVDQVSERAPDLAGIYENRWKRAIWIDTTAYLTDSSIEVRIL